MPLTGANRPESALSRLDTHVNGGIIHANVRHSTHKHAKYAELQALACCTTLT